MMKKSNYFTPAVRQKHLDYEENLLTASAEHSESSSLEEFEDGGDTISW